MNIGFAGAAARAATCGAVAVLSLGPWPVALAQPKSGAPASVWPDSACKDTPAAQAAALAQIDSWVRAQPARALAAVCAGPYSPEAAVLAAEALVELSRTEAAAALLAPLQVDMTQQPLPAWAPHWSLVQGLMLGSSGRSQAAEPFFQQTREQLEASGQGRSRLAFRVRVAQALLWRRAGALDRAQTAADEAQALLPGLGLVESMEATDVLNLRTLIAFSRQDLPGALAAARAEVQMLERLGQGDSPDVMFAWSSQGSILSQLGRHEEARAAFRAGLRIADSSRDVAPYGHQGLLYNLAVEHINLGEHEQALALAERALAVGHKAWGESSPRHLRPLLIIGNAHHQAARYGLAIRAFRQAEGVAQVHHASIPLLLRMELADSLAGALMSLGDREEAASTLQAALDVAAGNPNLSFWQGRLLIRRAYLGIEAQRWAQVDADAAEAIRRVGAVQGAQHAQVVEWGALRCMSQLRGKLPSTACEDLAHALPALNTAAPFRRHRALAALAEHALAQQRGPEAEERLFAAFAAAQSQGGPDPLWLALDALARHMHAQGQPALAVYFGKQALAAIEQMRGEVAGSAKHHETGFLANKVDVYRRLAGWLAEQGRVAEALETLRQLKEEEFFDYTQRNGALVVARAPIELTANERQLDERWQTLQLRSRSRLDEAAWAARARSVVGEMARMSTEPGARSRAEPPRHVIPVGELHVHAIGGEQQLTLVLDGTSERRVLQLDWPLAVVGREVGALLAAVSQRGDTLPMLQSLYRRLGETLVQAAQAAQAQRLVLHLDGSLRYLPVAALHDGQLHLGQRLSIEHRSAGAAGSPAVAGEPLALRALGLTRAVAGRKALPGVAREVCAIVDGPVHGLGAAGCQPGPRGVVRGEAWLDEQFTAERLGQALRERPLQTTSLLHVGTHFELRPGSIERSSLLLGDGTSMSLAQLAGHSFSGQALVTLSACETGVGGAQGADGREVEGLNMTILRRGAQAVLASLWRVDDGSTSALMGHFYRELRSAPPPLALQRAQQALRDSSSWASPFHWAGFYVTTALP